MPRGFFRLWVVLSVAWLAAFGFLATGDIRRDVAAIRVFNASSLPPPGYILDDNPFRVELARRAALDHEAAERAVTDLWRLAFAAVAPILMLGLLFAGFIWVLNGFRRRL